MPRHLLPIFPSKKHEGLQSCWRARAGSRASKKAPKESVHIQIQCGRLTCFCVRLLPTSFTLLNQSSLDKTGGGNNPSKNRWTSCFKLTGTASSESRGCPTSSLALPLTVDSQYPLDNCSRAYSHVGANGAKGGEVGMSSSASTSPYPSAQQGHLQG